MFSLPLFFFFKTELLWLSAHSAQCLPKKVSRLFKYLSISVSFVYLVYVCANKNTGTPTMAKIPRIA